MSNWMPGFTCKMCVWWSREPYRLCGNGLLKPLEEDEGICRRLPHVLDKHQDEWCAKFKMDKGRVKR